MYFQIYPLQYKKGITPSVETHQGSFLTVLLSHLDILHLVGIFLKTTVCVFDLGKLSQGDSNEGNRAEDIHRSTRKPGCILKLNVNISKHNTFICTCPFPLF